MHTAGFYLISLFDPILKVLEASMQEGSGKMSAHVVAPCPHDGVCPMEGTRSWCHFSQRFERSGLQRVTKIRSDGGLARTYQVNGGVSRSSMQQQLDFLLLNAFNTRAWEPASNFLQ
jgi:ribosomal protein RSM22 (predicted rRNA methylase)